ncbi:MAG: ComEC/Rec2 family competence protein [Bdellovibrionota bacterium]
MTGVVFLVSMVTFSISKAIFFGALVSFGFVLSFLQNRWMEEAQNLSWECPIRGEVVSLRAYPTLQDWLEIKIQDSKEIHVKAIVEDAYAFAPGDSIEFCSPMKSMAKNLWLRDRKDFYDSRDLFFSADLTLKDSISSHVSSVSLRGFFHRKKQIFSQFSKQVLSDSGHSALMAQLFGEPYGEVFLNAYKKLGILHLLVVSGFHVGLIFLLGSFVGRGLFSFLIPWYSEFSVRFFQQGMGAMFLLLYFWMARHEIPSLRAYGFFSVLIISRCFLSQPNLLSVFFWVATWFVVRHPSVLFDLSFQLSFGSTLVILFLIGSEDRQAKVLLQADETWKSKMRDYLGIQWFAWAGSLPLIVYWFSSFYPWSFLGGLLFGIPIGVCSVVLGVLSWISWCMNLPAISMLALKGVDALHAMALETEQMMEKYMSMQWSLPHFSALSYLSYIVFLYASMVAWKHARSRPKNIRGPWFLLASFLIFLVCFVWDSHLFFFYSKWFVL